MVAGRGSGKLPPAPLSAAISVPICALLLSRRGGLVKPAVDLGDLLHPTLPFGVIESQHFVHGPMEMVGDVGYLLVQAVEGVAYDTPPKLARSTSNFAWHSGHVTGMVLCPSSLMRR
jgi:hypothetical protein